MGAAAAKIASNRQTDPASLRRLVDGDLTWITMKALEKLRERRYASVAELAADIQRHIEDRPVLASSPGGLYRAHKFLRRHRAAVFGITAGIVFIVLGGVTVWSLLHSDSPPRPKLADKKTIVLADFANATGDPVFDGALRQILAVQLGNSSYLAPLSDARVSQTLRLMVQPPDAKITPDIAAKICERTGSAAVVEGSITRLESEYMLDLRAKNCQTGDVLDEEQVPAAKKADVSKALGQMVNRFGTRAGESLPRVEKGPSIAAEVTTPSLEAWKSYNAAMKAIQRRGEVAENVSLLKRAIEVDPKFAMAYSLLGRTYSDLGESELGAQNSSKAYELRDRVSDRENFFITYNYYRQVQRNLEMTRQTAESWAREYPGDDMPHSFLSGLTSMGTGHYEKAAEESERTIELNPNFTLAYENAAFAYVYLNRLSQAETVLRKASELKMEVLEFSILRYFIAFLRSDQAAMEREVTQRQAKMEAQGWFQHQEALTLAYHGRLKEADRLSARAVDLARQGGLLERPALFEGAGAVWNALFGNRAEAQKSAAAALSL